MDMEKRMRTEAEELKSLCEDFEFYSTKRHMRAALGEPERVGDGVVWKCSTKDGRQFTVERDTDGYDDGYIYQQVLFRVRGEDSAHTKEVYELVTEMVGRARTVARAVTFERCECLYEMLVGEVRREIMSLIPENGDTLFVEELRALNEFYGFEAHVREGVRMEDRFFIFCGVRNDYGGIVLLGYPSVNGSDDEHPFDPTDVHEVSMDDLVSNHGVLDVMEMMLYYFKMDELKRQDF